LHEAVQVGEDFCSRRYRDEMTSLLKYDYNKMKPGLAKSNKLFNKYNTTV
jgi:hypothetical protein